MGLGNSRATENAKKLPAYSATEIKHFYVPTKVYTVVFGKDAIGR